MAERPVETLGLQVLVESLLGGEARGLTQREIDERSPWVAGAAIGPVRAGQTATEDEERRNPRSRSAKLRAGERQGGGNRAQGLEGKGKSKYRDKRR